MIVSRATPVFKDARMHPLAAVGSPAVHRYEVSLGALVAVNVCFLPWAFGGVDVWAQWISLALASAALTVALLPRSPVNESRPTPSVSSKPHDRLLAFPVFWAGLILFAYVGVQLLNPAYLYHEEGLNWWLSAVDHISWLPSGMAVPFVNASPGRWLITAGTSGLTVCALWIGVTRRRTIFTILSIMAANAFIFACFGIVQRASGTTAVYGARVVGYPYFFSALIYKNHAAAFLGLAACVALAASLYHSRRNRPAHRSGPEVIFFLCTTILLLSLILTFSFSGLVLFGGAFLVALLSRTRRGEKKRSESTTSTWPLITGIGLLGCSAAVAGSIGYCDWQEKIHSLFASDAHDSARMRLLADRRGWEMFEDHWAKGWGAGCFQYGFTKYQAREAELKQKGSVQLRWEHVHNEWLELLIELGLVGVMPIVFIGGYWIRKIWREQLWRSSAAPVLSGLCALMAQAVMDFPFQNLAVLLTAAALLPLSVRLAEIENRLQ